MGFWFSFDDANNLFDGFDATTSFDPFEADESDVDRSGLSGQSDDLDESSPFETDEDAEETFEDLDEDDVEVGEDIEEDLLNEPDLDFDVQDGAAVEPDWNPEDQMEAEQGRDATDISDEQDPDTKDTELDDEPYDEWSETTPYNEVSQEDDVIEDDDIWQGEETGYDEPQFYDDPEEDLDADPSDNIETDMAIQDQDVEFSDISEMVDWMGQFMNEAAQWVEEEPPLDFTDVDTSSFHEVSEGFQIDDGYDPPVEDFMADDMLELGNIVDDVFANLFEGPDMGDGWFQWFDSFE